MGAVPWSPIFLPLGSSPLVKTGVMLSNSLIFLASSARMLPDGTSFFSEKYSVSSMSKEFGWVIDALGDVVGGRGDVFDLDAGVLQALLGDVVALVHGGAEIAQHLRLGRHRHRESR